jgi:hypothetical protein
MTRLTPSDVGRDTQLCLEAAARLAFPDGSVSAMTLRAEAARGKLAIFRIGKKILYDSPVPPRVRISIPGAGPGAKHAGQSETEAMKSARAALLASVEELKTAGNQSEKNLTRDRGGGGACAGRHGNSDAGDGDAGIFDLPRAADNRNKHLRIRHANRKDDG